MTTNIYKEEEKSLYECTKNNKNYSKTNGLNLKRKKKKKTVYELSTENRQLGIFLMHNSLTNINERHPQ